mgnify:CR=1 FL=1
MPEAEATGNAALHRGCQREFPRFTPQTLHTAAASSFPSPCTPRMLTLQGQACDSLDTGNRKSGTASGMLLWRKGRNEPDPQVATCKARFVDLHITAFRNLRVPAKLPDSHTSDPHSKTSSSLSLQYQAPHRHVRNALLCLYGRTPTLMSRALPPAC